ncbi:uncharacterized protein A4U43_C06F13370 [Asparagus officinalis]|uniref:Uncharacterized protein n=1 Tax=Asparagus officinalis TaxID=4686 RepID=A0A5P1EQ30_ASPOF|nr:uncharacterized protein A4U43_C06F13370 [Asparagus officinalis]
MGGSGRRRSCGRSGGVPGSASLRRAGGGGAGAGRRGGGAESGDAFGAGTRDHLAISGRRAGWAMDEASAEGGARPKRLVPATAGGSEGGRARGRRGGLGGAGAMDVVRLEEGGGGRWGPRGKRGSKKGAGVRGYGGQPCRGTVRGRPAGTGGVGFRDFLSVR